MAQRTVLNGRFAEASLGGTLIALLTDWEWKVATDIIDLSAHGDVWKRKKPKISDWTFNAKSFVVLASAAHLINQLYSSGSLPALVTVAGYSGSVSGGTKIFEGAGYPSGAFLTAPMGVATQGFDLEGDGPPTTGV